MHLDLQEEDEVFALLFARPRGVFFLCVCADARMCTLAVKGHPQQESLIDSRRIRREANTGANKCALVQSQLHVLALLCRQLLLQEMTPSWLASTINELSSWNTTKMSMFSCIFFFFWATHSHPLHIRPNKALSSEN